MRQTREAFLDPFSDDNCVRTWRGLSGAEIRGPVDVNKLNEDEKDLKLILELANKDPDFEGGNKKVWIFDDESVLYSA